MKKLKKKNKKTKLKIKLLGPRVRLEDYGNQTKFLLGRLYRTEFSIKHVKVF